MARIRTIKPEFWTDETLTECSLSARLLFIGIWNFADDNGNIEASIKQMKMKIFPADDVQILPLVVELLTHGLLTEYSIDGHNYLNVKSFKKHQLINRPSKTKIPDYEDSLRTHVLLTEDSLTEGKGRERKGKETPKNILSDFEQKTEQQNPKPKNLLSEYSDDFLKFWSVYPSKTGKGAAFRAWNKAKPPIDKVITALEWQAKSQKWREGYIPNPQTYINQRRWDDEPDTAINLKAITTSRGQDRINGAMEVLARRNQKNGRSEETRSVIEIGRSI